MAHPGRRAWHPLPPPSTQSALSSYVAAASHVPAFAQVAGNVARDFKRSRITPRHLALAIRGDAELHQLLHDATIPQGGVLPHIEEALLRRGGGVGRGGQGE